MLVVVSNGARSAMSLLRCEIIKKHTKIVMEKFVFHDFRIVFSPLYRNPK